MCYGHFCCPNTFKKYLKKIQLNYPNQHFALTFKSVLNINSGRVNLIILEGQNEAPGEPKDSSA